MGRSLNQQTLQHLDALQQQQLRLQVNSPVGGLNLRLAAAHQLFPVVLQSGPTAGVSTQDSDRPRPRDL